MGEAKRRKLAGYVEPALIRCHYCGMPMDLSKPYFRFFGEKPHYWHADQRQCMGKDMVRTILCLERGVL